jgi:MFS family permease
VVAIILAGYLLILIDVSIPHGRAADDRSRSRLLGDQPVVGPERLRLGVRRSAAAGRAGRRPAGPAAHARAPFWLSASRSPRVDDRRRAVQGIGAAILAPWTLALLVHSLPEGPRRTRAMAAYGALAGIGTSVGLSSSAAR